MSVCYGYGRRSTSQQEDTPEVQEGTIRRYFEYKLAPEGYEWGGFVLDSASGVTAFCTREQGARLDQKLEKGDCLVFSKLDRGFRNLTDVLHMFASWDARGIKVVAIDLGVDTSTPIGRVIVRVMAVIAEFERERMGERMREFQLKRKAEGRPYCKAVYGFKNVGPKGNRRLVPDPEGRRIGKKAIQWRLEGGTFEALYWALFKAGERRRDGSEWALSTIKRHFVCELKLLAAEAKRKDGSDAKAQ